MLDAAGTLLTNKYAEGYPGRRYYGGCQFVDIAERLAIERVTKLFGCKFANVQPHSGAQANQAVFMALRRTSPVSGSMPCNMACVRATTASTTTRWRSSRMSTSRR